MCLDGRRRHSTSAGCKHAESDDNTIVACGCVIVEPNQIMLENATEIVGKLCHHDWVHRGSAGNGAELAVV
jgi:hypothetical protein